MGAVATVAKKTGPKPSAEGPRESLIALKCRKPYKDWVAKMADELRTTPSGLIDLALFELAKARGLKLPPKR